jgi:hypothetical protein
MDEMDFRIVFSPRTEHLEGLADWGMGDLVLVAPGEFVA